MTVERAMNFIDDHFTEPITLNDVAEMAYMSPNYFSQYFKKVTGQNFSDYLSGLRIKKAQELLKNSDMSVIDIAMACGFHNMSNFYRMYKKHTGSTPSAQADS